MRRSISLAVALCAWSLGVHAASINVLWYTYADPLSEYRTTGIPGIAAGAGDWVEGGGLDWNLTFYDNASPTPDFSLFDVLVTESGEPFRTGAPGGSNVVPNYAGVLDNKDAITAARGERTAIVGTDADFHAIRGDSGGQCTPSNPSVCGQWNGARGLLINLVDWAASGDGLGIVALLDGEQGPLWWQNPNSFLHDELAGHVSYFRDNAPTLSPVSADYPLNAGLTSAGLSSWINSFHASFTGVEGYTGTVFSTRSGHVGEPLVIVTSDFVSAPVSNVPLPRALWQALAAVLTVLLFVHARPPSAGRLRTPGA